jgi:ATP-binding protein involved in chromosome partitioning
MTVTDPRTSIINERIKKVHRIIAVSSGKGGVGKSLIASILALTLARKGFKVALFDLDFTSPSTHTILGIKDVSPMENKGIVPAQVHGLEYMSIIYYSRDRAVPLRGFDVSNALIELLSITIWGELDYLVLDMPPGIGDVTLDLIRLIENTEFLIVTTSSQLAFETVKKLVSLLEITKTPMIGVVENMKMDGSKEIRRETEKLKLKFLTGIHYDERVELAIGNVQRLLETEFAKSVQKLALAI